MYEGKQKKPGVLKILLIYFFIFLVFLLYLKDSLKIEYKVSLTALNRIFILMAKGK